MTLTRQRASKIAAFSLVEMMTAIFLAMLIIGIAVLSIGAVNEEARIRRIGATLEVTARSAMQNSVLERRDHWIEFSAREFTTAPNGKTHPFPEGAQVELRHWGETSWKSPSSDERWRFSHEGLCEPLQIRLTLGKATLEMQFDPLTGAVAEESLIVEKG
jgi:hypothetical protein